MPTGIRRAVSDDVHVVTGITAPACDAAELLDLSRALAAERIDDENADLRLEMSAVAAQRYGPAVIGDCRAFDQGSEGRGRIHRVARGSAELGEQGGDQQVHHDTQDSRTREFAQYLGAGESRAFPSPLRNTNQLVPMEGPVNDLHSSQ
jgi:hypothetical protein